MNATSKAYKAPALVESGDLVRVTKSVAQLPPIDSDRTFKSEAEGSLGFSL